MSERPYSYTIVIKPVVDFVSRDAELAVSFDWPDWRHPRGFQVVVATSCATQEQAQTLTSDYAQDLADEVEQFIRKRLSKLPAAKE